jgi:hypothetical protein
MSSFIKKLELDKEILADQDDDRPDDEDRDPSLDDEAAN